MIMKDTVLFDLDGTLTDPAEGITNSVAYALDKYGIKIEYKSSLNCFIGPPLSESFEKYYGFSKEESLRAVEIYREYFRDKGIFENRVYLGAEEMLSALKNSGRTVALATSKPEIFAKRILVHFQLDGYFDAICGSELDGSRVKKHDVIEYTLSTLGDPDRSRCIMVGDRLHDIEGARLSSIESIGVTYGYGSYDELKDAGADHIVHGIGDLKDLILSL